MVTKRTTGEFVQTFNDRGKLIRSGFVADDNCTYEDEDGNILSCDDPRYVFYAPFETVNVMYGQKRIDKVR